MALEREWAPENVLNTTDANACLFPYYNWGGFVGFTEVKFLMYNWGIFRPLLCFNFWKAFWKHKLSDLRVRTDRFDHFAKNGNFSKVRGWHPEVMIESEKTFFGAQHLTECKLGCFQRVLVGSVLWPQFFWGGKIMFAIWGLCFSNRWQLPDLT